MWVKTGFKYLSFEINDFTPENVQLISILIFADIGGYICEKQNFDNFVPDFSLISNFLSNLSKNLNFQANCADP